jgi:hypothetical protein
MISARRFGFRSPFVAPSLTTTLRTDDVRRLVTRHHVSVLMIASLVVCVGSAAPAVAQFVSTSSIEGAVTDESGGILPGVSVTLTSPALQVSSLVQVTNSEGHYAFEQLRAGVYQLRYELSGFTPLIRSDLQLGVGFSAKVNIVLKVGSVAETVTVSGASPIVDVTTTTAAKTLSAQLVNDLIPTSRMVGDMSRLVPSMITTSAPNIGQLGLGTTGGYNAFGDTGQNVMIDGLEIRSNTYPDFSSAEEVDVKMFANSADVSIPGAVWNIVTKSGGNQFHGRLSELYINPKFQGDNLDATLRSQGLSYPNSLKYFTDFGADLGGKIVQDKLWFYGNFRDRQNKQAIPGLSAAPGPDGQYGTADDVPYFPVIFTRNYTGKLSYQPSPKYQFIAFYAEDYSVNNGAGVSSKGAQRFIPEEASTNETFNPTNWRGEFRAILKDNLVFNAQSGRVSYVVDYEDSPSCDPTKPASWDRNTQIFTGCSVDTVAGNFAEAIRPRYEWVNQGKLTYSPQAFLGGSHEVMIGYRTWIQQGATNIPVHPAGDYQLTFDVVNGVPHQPAEIIFFNAPVTQANREHSYSGYINDRWEAGKRLTLNLGVRYDYDHSFVPAQTKPQGPFGGAGTFSQFEGNTWKNWSPRFAFAYDLTGDAKSVIKGTIGVYNAEMADSFASPFNQNGEVATDYRWHDLNHNNNYDPGEVNLDTNGPDFISITGAANNIFNPNLQRPHEDEFGASFDREIMPNTSVRAGYVYKRMVGTIDTVNVLRPPSDFTIALTRRDPGPDGIVGTADDGGLITVYDYPKALAGSAYVGNQMLNRPDSQADHYHTIEFTLNKRMTGNWAALTSFSTTKFHRWLVGTIQSPNDNYYPIDETWNWVYKVNGTYRFPYDIMVSGLFDLQPGIRGQRTYVFRAADPNGGPALQGQSTVTLRLDPYGSEVGPIRPSLNLRAAKVFRLPKGRLQLSVDALNALNTNTFWAMTFVSGPTYGYGTSFTNPRALQFGATFQY